MSDVPPDMHIEIQPEPTREELAAIVAAVTTVVVQDNSDDTMLSATGVTRWVSTARRESVDRWPVRNGNHAYRG